MTEAVNREDAPTGASSDLSASAISSIGLSVFVSPWPASKALQPAGEKSPRPVQTRLERSRVRVTSATQCQHGAPRGIVSPGTRLPPGVAVATLLTGGRRYGRDVIRLVSRAPRVINPRPGTVYRAFESLACKGYLRSWTVVPGGRRGAKIRKYYELTPRGMAAAERQHQALAALLDLPTQPPSSTDAELMGARASRNGKAPPVCG